MITRSTTAMLTTVQAVAEEGWEWAIAARSPAVVVAIPPPPRTAVPAGQGDGRLRAGAAVSAFATRDTGPLRVSFVEQRRRALDACGRP